MIIQTIDIILLSVLVGFFKACADILDFRFKDSWFNRFKWNQYIDPEVSHLNKEGLKFPWSFLLTPFSDLWHLSYTLMIYCFLLMLPFYSTFEYMNDFQTLVILYVSYGVGFEITYATLLYFKKEEEL